MAADNTPRKYERPPRLSNISLSPNPIRDPNTWLPIGPKYIYMFGPNGYEKDWVPVVGEDKRDLRDPEEVGKEYLARHS